MILIPVPVAGGQSWTDILTAIGTVAAAAAAVGIAVWSHWDTSKRIADERRVTREREQLAEAYLVQVVLGEKYLIVKDVPIERLSTAPNIYGEWTDALHLAVMAVNRGSFTITSVEAQFSYDGVSLEPPQGYQRLSGFGNVRPRLREGWSPSSERAMHGVLAPWDAGIRFESDEVSAERLNNPYPLVRWTDRWGTRWEHRRGEVRQVREDAPWVP